MDELQDRRLAASAAAAEAATAALGAGLSAALRSGIDEHSARRLGDLWSAAERTEYVRRRVVGALEAWNTVARLTGASVPEPQPSNSLEQALELALAAPVPSAADPASRWEDGELWSAATVGRLHLELAHAAISPTERTVSVRDITLNLGSHVLQTPAMPDGKQLIRDRFGTLAVLLLRADEIVPDTELCSLTDPNEPPGRRWHAATQRVDWLRRILKGTQVSIRNVRDYGHTIDSHDSPGGEWLYEVGVVAADVKCRRCFLRGEPLPLSKAHYEIVATLAEWRGEAVPRTVLRERLRAAFVKAENSRLTYHVHALRKQLGVPENSDELIEMTDTHIRLVGNLP